MSNEQYHSATTSRKATVKPAVTSAVVLGAIYVATLLILPRDGFWINDNGCKFIQLQGLIKTGYKDFSIPWPGQSVDPAYTCNPLPPPFGHVIDGKLYATFSPVFPLLSSFFYRLLGNAGLYILPLLGGLLTLPAVWLLAGRLSAGSSARRLAQPLAVFVVGLCTPLWFYSATFWEHMPAVCLIAWSVLCCIYFVESDSTGRLAAAAALCGLAVYFRDELYLFGVVIVVISIVYSRQRRRDVLVFAAVFVLALLPLWAFQWFALGHPLGHHFRTGSLLDISVAQHVSSRWSVASLLLLNTDQNTWLSVAIAAPYVVLLLRCPRTRRCFLGRVIPVLSLIAILTGVVIMARHLQAESPVWWLVHTNGLFATSPILLLAFIRPRQGDNDPDVEEGAGTRERLRRAVWLMVLLYIIVYILLAPGIHSGGIHWGCRYLLPVFPLLGAMAAATIGDWWTSHHSRLSLGRLALCLTVALSICLQVYSLTLLYRRKTFSAELNRVVAQRPERVIVASGWFLPQELACCFFDQQVFLINTQRAADRLISVLRQTSARNILYAASPPTPAAGQGESVVLDDGSLRFISVELRPIDLAE